MLSTVFSHSESLTEIAIGDHYEEPFGPFLGEETSFGMKAVDDAAAYFYSQMTVLNTKVDYDHTSLIHVFNCALHALAIARRPIQKLSAHCRLGNDPMEIYAIWLPGIEPLRTYLAEGLRTALHPLRSLSLSVSFSSGFGPEGSHQWLVHLIRICPLLECLKLTFDGWRFSSMDDDVRVTCFEDLADEVELPRLRMLTLQNTELSSSGLGKFLRQAVTTLETLTLRLLKLESGDWTSTLLQSLGSELLELNTLHLAWLLERNDEDVEGANVIAFEKENMTPCRRCDYDDVLRHTWPCDHVSTSLQRKDICDLRNTAKLPLEYFCQKFEYFCRETGTDDESEASSQDVHRSMEPILATANI